LELNGTPERLIPTVITIKIGGLKRMNLKAWISRLKEWALKVLDVMVASYVPSQRDKDVWWLNYWEFYE
jgi:hypothetical protein